MFLSKEKLQLAKTISKDDVICLHDDNAIVTNGKFLLSVAGELKDSADDFPDVGIDPGYTPKEDLLSVSTADKVLKNLPKDEVIQIINNAILGRNGNEINIGITDLKSSIIISQKDISNPFPKVEKINEIMNLKSEFILSLDINLLEKVTKAIKLFSGAGFSKIDLYNYNESEGLLIKAKKGSQTITAIIMGVVPDKK